MLRKDWSYMVRLNFTGDISEVEEGISILKEELNFEVCGDGLTVNVKRKAGGNIEVHFDGENAQITYAQRIHFFRCLGLLLEGIANGEKPFRISETPQFDTSGVMLDVSRNAVLHVDGIKNMLRKMAVMGLNLAMLYTEDTFEVEQYPYFGYMRGRYSFSELKECDDYANALGIEMVPCIQTLAHLSNVLKWSFADDFKDTEDILLVGEEKTYEFIENIIKAAAAPFRSNRIHIGMDEAHNLGLGRYLKLNGYRRRFDIMCEHLDRVFDIVKKLGLEPMMWSDMFFRLGSKTGDYYDKEAAIPADIAKRIPGGLKLVYWDYYHRDENDYTHFLRKHKSISANTVFAGGIWVWGSLCPFYEQTILSTNAALCACKKEGIREVFATMWGDDGAETSVFCGLLGLQLYAEHTYNKTVTMQSVKSRFGFCAGADADLFLEFSAIDDLPPASGQNHKFFNPSKYFLWQDVLLGIYDKNIYDADLEGYYKNLYERLSSFNCTAGRWKDLLEFYKCLCSVLKDKVAIGIRLKKCYDEKDKKMLAEMGSTIIPNLIGKVIDLRKAHRRVWLAYNKPFGWEVLDIRYGGVLSRLDTAIDRINNYLDGKISVIEELEQERLYFVRREDDFFYQNSYRRIATTCPI